MPDDALADAADVADAAAAAAAAEQAAGDRPSDADILAHAASVREEQASRPLIGAREPLSSLVEDFAGGAPALVRKCEALASRYSHVRRTRRDGNWSVACAASLPPSLPPSLPALA